MRDSVMQTDDDFFRSHLVVWTRCLHQQDGSFQCEDLLSCELFSSLMKAIWPPCADNEALFEQLTTEIHSHHNNNNNNSDAIDSFQHRYNKWAALVRTLISFYETALQQLVLVTPPNVTVLASTSSKHRNSHQKQKPHQIDDDFRNELENILRLILGCAVQAESTKEHVISFVTTLDLEVQHALRVEIEAITHNRSNVFPLECLTSPSDTADLKFAAGCLSRLVDERNELFQRCSYLQNSSKSNQNGQNCLDASQNSEKRPPSPRNGNQISTEEQAKFYLQVAELKNQLRECRGELESKSELLEQSREDFDEKAAQVERMRLEISDLQREARSARELRDELDAAKQDSARCERLERENAKLRDKVNEFEVMKKRLDEVKEENRVLVEVRSGLERRLGDKSSINRFALQDAEIERRRKENVELRSSLEASQRLIEELSSRCSHLQSELATSSMVKNGESSSDHSPFSVEDQPFSEQLEESVTGKLLTLELENESLRREIDDIQLRRLEKLGEVERELERTLDEKNEVLKDREKLRHLLDRVRDGYDSKLRVAFSLVAVIKQEILAGSTSKSSKIIAELLDQLAGDFKTPVVRGDNEFSTPDVSIDDKMFSKVRELLVSNEKFESVLLELKALETELEELEISKKVLGEERDLLSSRLERCLETIEILQKRQDELAQEKQTIQFQLKQSEEAVDQLKQCLDSNNEALRLAEEEGNRLKSMLTRVNTCMDHFFGVKGGVEEIANSLQNAEAAPKLVENLVETSRWADPRLAEVTGRLQKVETEKMVLERELNAVKVEEGRKTGDLARDVFSMKNRLVELERQNASLSSENGSLKFQSSELQRQLKEMSTDLAQLQKVKSDLVAEKARLETELGAADDRMTGLMTDRDLCQARIGELDSEKSSLKHEYNELIRQFADMKSEITRMQSEIASESMAAKSAQTECRVLAEQARRSQAEADQLRESMDSAQKSSSEASSMLAQLQAENQELVLQRASLQNEHTRLEEKFKQVFHDLRKYQSVNPESLLAKIDYLRQMNDRLESAVTDMSEQMRSLLKHNEDLLNGKLKESEKHNSEQKYYMEMLATVQRQKSTLEGKMMELWNEQNEKQRRRTSSTSIEQLVRKAKHLFQKQQQQQQQKVDDSSALMTAPNSSTISPLNNIDSSSNSDSVTSCDENDLSFNNFNSSISMSRSMSIDLYKSSTPLKPGVGGGSNPSSGNKPRWVASDRPSQRRATDNSICSSNFGSDNSSCRAFNGSDCSTSRNNATASTRTLTSLDASQQVAPSSNRPDSASSSLSGLGNMASAVAVVTIPPSSNAHHSLLSPALSSSASGQSDDAKMTASMPNGSEEDSVWYEFGCV